MITINDIQRNLSKITRKSSVNHAGGVFKNYKKEVNSSFCSGQILAMQLENITIRRLHLNIKEREEIQFSIPEECINVYFLFNGHGKIEIIPGPDFHLHIGTHNLFYTPPCTCKIHVLPCRYELFYMRLPIPVFKEYTRQNKGIFIPFYRGVEARKCVFLRSEHGIIGHRIHRIVDEICSDTDTRELRPLFVKAKIIELLSIQMEQLCNFCSPPSSLSQESAQKMFAVRDFMIQNIGGYHSLKELAKKVGTNEFTLKKEFKELFGNTVFGFWHEIKMEKAQKLLLAKELPIKEISEIVGYKNPQHFSTAFKNKYGITPSNFRKRR